jgi:hypothetical protein
MMPGEDIRRETGPDADCAREGAWKDTVLCRCYSWHHHSGLFQSLPGHGEVGEETLWSNANAGGQEDLLIKDFISAVAMAFPSSTTMLFFVVTFSKHINFNTSFSYRRIPSTPLSTTNTLTLIYTETP